MANVALQKLRPHHKLAITLKAGGKSNDDIAAALDTTPATVRQWFKQKIVKEELDRQLEVFTQTLQNTMARATVGAYDALLAMAQAPGLDQHLDPEARLAAIREILDRNAETAKAGTPGTEDSPNTVFAQFFQNATDDDLQTAAMELAKDLMDGSSGNGQAAIEGKARPK